MNGDIPPFPIRLYGVQKDHLNSNDYFCLQTGPSRLILYLIMNYFDPAFSLICLDVAHFIVKNLYLISCKPGVGNHYG
jgi:hypothetical protein